MQIQPRDGSKVQFDAKKILNAVTSAFKEVRKDESIDLSSLMNSILSRINKNFPEQLCPDCKDFGTCSECSVCRRTSVSKESIVTIEQVQEIVESCLMHSNMEDVARAYIIYRNKKDELRKRRSKPSKEALSEYIHVAKYAKYDHKKGRKETFQETVDRVFAMHSDKFSNFIDSNQFFKKEFLRAYERVSARRVLPSMRSMQFGGVAIRVNHSRLYNCSYTHINRPEVFGQIMWLLLGGCGVGYSVQWRHVEELPDVKHIDSRKVFHFTVPDTIEGWGDAITALTDSYFKTGVYVEFDYSQIRAEGTELVTSGGKAPGHLPLKNAIELIRSLLNNASGRQLRPIECHDLCCYIAQGVLAGGIRRSSLICIFSPEDTEMMYAKAPGNFSSYGVVQINKQREMANNSAIFLRGVTPKSVFLKVMKLANQGFGEPGFYFSDDLDAGPNPCGEIGLLPVLHSLETKKTGFAFCNLTEVNGAVATTPEELYEAVESGSFIGSMQAAYTNFDYLGEVTKKIAERDALLGVGICGMMDNPAICFDPLVLREAARRAMEMNKKVAEIIGINPAQRVTTIKPSGTASLALGGVGSGIHPQHSKRYFRRVTANPNEDPAKVFKQYNPHMVETKPNGDWSLIFCIETPDDTLTRHDFSAIEMTEKVFLVYDNWIIPGTLDIRKKLTHNVSCTVTVSQEELPALIEHIWTNQSRIGAMSFAPPSLDKMYSFPPLEEISTPEDEVKWNRLISGYKPVPWESVQMGTSSQELEPACSGGKCERI